MKHQKVISSQQLNKGKFIIQRIWGQKNVLLSITTARPPWPFCLEAEQCRGTNQSSVRVGLEVRRWMVCWSLRARKWVDWMSINSLVYRIHYGYRLSLSLSRFHVGIIISIVTIIALIHRPPPMLHHHQCGINLSWWSDMIFSSSTISFYFCCYFLLARHWANNELILFFSSDLFNCQYNFIIIRWREVSLGSDHSRDWVICPIVPSLSLLRIHSSPTAPPFN